MNFSCALRIGVVDSAGVGRIHRDVGKFCKGGG